MPNQPITLTKTLEKEHPLFLPWPSILNSSFGTCCTLITFSHHTIWCVRYSGTKSCAQPELCARTVRTSTTKNRQSFTKRGIRCCIRWCEHLGLTLARPSLRGKAPHQSRRRSALQHYPTPAKSSSRRPNYICESATSNQQLQQLQFRHGRSRFARQCCLQLPSSHAIEKWY